MGSGDFAKIRKSFSEFPKVDVAINIIIAAVITRLLLAGMDKVTGTITSMAILNKAAG